MPHPKLTFRLHAIQRMFERDLTNVDGLRRVLAEGETIEEYSNDFPNPTRLILGWLDEAPLHMAVSENRKANETIIVTVYVPDPAQWTDDFRSRDR
jgi:hypothetical protein